MKTFLPQFRFELLKLFARPRTWVGFVAFFIVELIILALMQTPRAQKMFVKSMTMHDMSFDHYNSGLTLAHVMITNTIFLLGSLYLALVCGDMMAKEVEDGTLRMVLSRPVSRDRILLVKYAACVFYTWSLTLFIVLSSLALGLAVRGPGGLLVVDPFQQIFGVFELGEGLGRFALGTGVLCVVMLTLSSLGFMFSCFNVRPATATILTLSVYIVDTVLRTIPWFEDYRGWLLTHNMGVWSQVFQPDIPWYRVSGSLFYLGTFDAACLMLGALYFFHRDFKS